MAANTEPTAARSDASTRLALERTVPSYGRTTLSQVRLRLRDYLRIHHSIAQISPPTCAVPPDC
jgi:hypothetical protein